MSASYCLFGAKTVIDLLEKLLEQQDGVREARDVEYVHRMRVATRRLREALPLFRECFPEREFAKWTKAIRRLTRALGGARDADVQIGAVAEALSGASARDAPGLGRLLLRLRQKRAELQKEVSASLERFAKSGAESSMEACLRVLLGQSRIEEPADEEDEFRSRITEAVRRRLADVMGFEIPIRNPRNVAQLHEMRKALKRLRYTLEIFAPLSGKGTDESIKKVRSLQDTLGALHDCDVWLEKLPRFIGEEQDRMMAWQGHARGMGRLRSGLESFAASKRETRNATYEAFIAAWDRLCKNRWWEEILKGPERTEKNDPESQ